MNNRFKNFLIILLIIIVLIFVSSINGKNKIVVMKIDNYEEIEIELYRNVAPITVDNFLQLVEANTYTDIIFHRIVPGFVVQAGNTKVDGTTISSKNIKGEFKSNGINNTLKHTKGVISMARASDPNSASNQFFIMLEDNSGLDDNYAAFGKVIKGLDVIEKITPKDNSMEEYSPEIMKEKVIDIPTIKYIKVKN